MSKEIFNSNEMPGYRIRHMLEFPNVCESCRYQTWDYGGIRGCNHPNHTCYACVDESGICDDFERRELWESKTGELGKLAYIRLRITTFFRRFS